MNVIGLGYRARAGKDTCADYLVKRYGYQKLSFAEPLKDAAHAIWGFTWEQLYGAEKGEVDPFWGMTPRHALQQLGTEVVRALGQDTWVKAMQRRIERRVALNPKVRIVIPDMRFPNEAGFIRGMRGLCVHVDRIGLPEATHASETALLDWDFDHVVRNYGSLDDLYAAVDAMIERHKLEVC